MSEGGKWTKPSAGGLNIFKCAFFVVFLQIFAYVGTLSTVSCRFWKFVAFLCHVLQVKGLCQVFVLFCTLYTSITGLDYIHFFPQIVRASPRSPFTLWVCVCAYVSLFMRHCSSSHWTLAGTPDTHQLINPPLPHTVIHTHTRHHVLSSAASIRTLRLHIYFSRT